MNISVIGTGYVGLVTGACLAEYGHDVICIDKDEEKITALRAGRIPIYEPGLAELVDGNVQLGRLSFTTHVADAVQASMVLFIAVGTPPGPNGEADLSHVRAVAAEIAENMPGYRVVVNKSTAPVGTADVVAGILAGRTPYPFDVVSNPEFLREGAAVKDCMQPDRIVVGVTTERAATTMRGIYETFHAPVFVTDPRSAEMIKYAANAFLATKISFINEVAGLCERLGADVDVVARGMGYDPRIGPHFLKAGIGYGGSCFPKDTQAMVAMGRRVDYETKLISAAIEVNQAQRMRLLNRIEGALGSLEGKTVGVLGLTFKPDTDDVRESPSLDVIQHVLVRGGTISAYDPKGMPNAKRALAARGWEAQDKRLVFAESGQAVANEADAIVLLTDWPEFSRLPWDEMHEAMAARRDGRRRAGSVVTYLFDARNFLDGSRMRVIGFSYYGIGRGTFTVDFESISGRLKEIVS